MALSGMSSQQSTYLYAGCAVLVTLGMWSVTTSVTQAHVSVRPAVQSVTRLAPLSHVTRSIPSVTSVSGPSSVASPMRAAAEVAAAGAAAGTPWLSLTAILLGVVAILINFFRGQTQPVQQFYSPPAPAPMPTYAPSPVDFTAIKSNRMDEIALATREQQANSKNLTPKQVILDLQRGNARFWSGTPERPELDAMQRRALIIGQTPKVAILSCADSRVPVEIVFDQGLGSVFVVRVAGNILDSTAVGSLEFATKYLGVKAILVMGHEACGAVKGAMAMSPADLQAQPVHLQTVLKTIKANLDVPKLNKIQDNRAQDREAVVTNCTAQVKTLQQNPLFKERIANGSLMVVGAFYEITSGIVDFFSLDKNGLVIDL